MDRVLHSVASLWLSQASLGPFFVWLGVGVAVVVAAGTGLLVYRRRVLSDQPSADARSGLMQGLRAMRDRGELSAEEYDAARHALAGGAGKSGRPKAAPDARVAPRGFDLTGAPLPIPPKSSGSA